MDKSVAIKDGICYMCSNSCPTKIHVQGGKAIKIDIADQRVAYCPRWKAQLDFVYHPDRLLHPVKRSGVRGKGSWLRISWEEALDTVAKNLQSVREKFGPESVVFWISYTKEPRPYFHRLAHAFGSPNYCTESSNCNSGAWLAANLTYGPEYAGLNGTGGAADPETKCKLVWGSAVISSPQNWQGNIEAIKKGVKYIVVDPRRTTIASRATIHLQLRPGTDGALALSMMNVIINQELYDKDFVTKWTIGFDELAKLVQEYPPERAAEITSVPAAKIREAAILYATSKPAKLHLSANSTTHHANGVQNHRAVILLPALTGNFDINGGNRFFFGTANQTNDITLHERIADMPPGVGSRRFPIWTERYREMQSNAIADQIEDSKPYPIKALFSSGWNAQFFGNSQRMSTLLQKLDFIAVSEYFHTPGTQTADVVLPIASWLERPILLTNYRGRARLIEPAISPVGESRTEWDIYAELAQRLGFGGMFWNGDFSKCADYILEPLKITLDDLRRQPEGIRLPSVKRPEKYYQKAGFPTPSGKVEISCATLAEHGLDALPVYYEPPENPLNPDMAGAFPLVMTSGARVMAYTHSQFRNIKQLRKLMPDPLVDIHPTDAKPRRIKNGDMVTINTKRNCIKMKAHVTDTILPGVVSMPHHWPGEANANALVDDKELDPISGFLPCKSQLCEVKKVKSPR